jgi:pantetheine-phosphate adenylyltransferase
MASRKGKNLQNDYSQRLETLVKTIEEKFPNNKFEINKLDNDFGPAVLQKEVQALVVSGETSDQGTVLNQLRKQKNLPPVDVVVVPMVLAKDGIRISTTRIKNQEIDDEGNLPSVD